jgi:hypothetical protein
VSQEEGDQSSLHSLDFQEETSPPTPTDTTTDRSLITVESKAGIPNVYIKPNFIIIIFFIIIITAE